MLTINPTHTTSQVYNVVKNLDTKCEDERVSELIYEIVNLLMGDEDQSNPLDTYNVKLPAEEKEEAAPVV